jgi:hypothetical protein
VVTGRSYRRFQTHEQEATMKLYRTIPLLAALLALGVLTACGAGSGSDREAETPTPPAAAPAPAPEEDAEDPDAEPVAETPAPVETEPEETIPPPKPRSCKPETGGQDGVYTNLVDVRIGSHPGYDRITFEFRAPKPNPGGKAGIPRYEIRAARPPFTQDASGEPLAVSGNAFVNLVFHGATGYDFEYQPTYHGPEVLRAGFDVLREAVRSGDFEATLGWVLGLERQTCWDAFELRNPDRVVIDLPKG